MTSLVQSSIFDFKPKERPAQWLMSIGERRALCRTDAEAFVRELGTIPTGAVWPRCLEIDHSRVYNAWCPWASARIWGHGGIGEEVLVDHTGRVEWWIDPYPPKSYFGKDGKQVRERVHARILSAEIEGDALRLGLEGLGDWLAEIKPDSALSRYDFHPYDPSRDLEHFAIECYRRNLPAGMFGWRECYIYGTPALRPFCRAVSAEDAKRADLMGNIPGAWERNQTFDEVCACAEAMGLALKLRHDVPALENVSMWPIENTCSSCLRKGSENLSEPCWKGGGVCNTGRWMWDRRTPAKPYTKGKKLAGTPRGCDEEEEECGC